MIPEDVTISETMGHFFRRFRIGRLLKQAGITKQGGEKPGRLLKFLLALVFTQRNFYRTLLRDDPDTPKKDTVYRFLASPRYNWRRLLLMTAAGIAQWLGTLVGPDRDAVFIVDDSLFDRSRSKKVELLARVYDHVEHVYRKGFRWLMLGWSDGMTFLPAAFSLLSSEQATHRLQPVDARTNKRTVSYRRRRESWQQSPDVVLQLLGEVHYVLFNSGFAFPRGLRHIAQDRNLYVIAMVKAIKTLRYTYEGQRYTLTDLYAHVKKRPGTARILAVAAVQLETQDGSQPVQLVFVR
ncbi:MAG: transposase, partial [Firmicutes bacterium]|nr:transposase [Bacillota bacterium]